MCWIQDPKERASAREVQQYLIGAIQNIAPEKIKEWGLEKEVKMVH